MSDKEDLMLEHELENIIEEISKGNIIFYIEAPDEFLNEEDFKLIQKVLKRAFPNDSCDDITDITALLEEFHSEMIIFHPLCQYETESGRIIDDFEEWSYQNFQREDFGRSSVFDYLESINVINRTVNPKFWLMNIRSIPAKKATEEQITSFLKKYGEIVK